MKRDPRAGPAPDTHRTWIRCRLCRARMMLTTAYGIAAMWCQRCDR